ncbi:MAG: hypothetical protein OQJ97_10770 [Rhodospirillales bacterium]|nr:hypothetical protein [Rhodospirillales bacterium]
MADLDNDQLEEEVIELRSEVDELKLELSRLSGWEEKAKDTRRLLEMLVVRLEETLQAPPPPPLVEIEELEIEEEAISAPELEDELLEEENFEEEEVSSDEIEAAAIGQDDSLQALAKDLAEIKDRLASDRAVGAEFRIDFEDFKEQLGIQGCVSVHQELEDVRKEISALQSRLLRASLNGDV